MHKPRIQEQFSLSVFSIFVCIVYVYVFIQILCIFAENTKASSMLKRLIRLNRHVFRKLAHTLTQCHTQIHLFVLVLMFVGLSVLTL